MAVVHKAKIVIELTQEEAQAMLEICNRIGGSPNYTRGIFDGRSDSIGTQLRRAGVVEDKNLENTTGGQINFRNI